MATNMFHGMRKLGRVFSDAGIRALNPTLRRASTLAQSKVVEGPNGERIIQSPYGDISPFSEMLIHEYVWNKAEDYPNKVALECGVSGKKYTFAQAKDASYYIGRSLHNIGLKKGDVVALVTPNLPDAVLSFLGILSGGFICTTMNPQYIADEISRQLQKSGVKAIITSTAIASTVRTAANTCLPPQTPFIVIDDQVGSMPEGSIPFNDLITRGKSLPNIKSDALMDDVAILPFSSGTTGLPKGVMLTHRNLVSNMDMVEEALRKDNLFHPTTDTYQEVVPAVLPFFHIYGLNAMMLPRLSKGNKLVTIPKFVPDTYLNILEKSKATLLYCVPPIILFLTASPLAKKQHLKYIHSIFSGAAPLAQSDVDRFYEKFKFSPDNLKFGQGYGLTESSPVAFTESTSKKFSSIGRNVASCEARIVDVTTKQDVNGPGKTGELWIRGPHIMKGYLNDETATKETLTEDKWLKTGDIAYYDKEYDFYITDRLKELIKVKGFQVPPAELEALLRSHPDVEEAAVIGIPHERYGEVPKAFVVLNKDKKPTEDDIKNFVKGKVSDYKELEGGVMFVTDIPKNPSGKILRSHLKREYAKS
ncbi:PREDICTED: probable 4-coumarate--CoA ligase 3 [Dinoponera quadriceps]|uniref:Luciferin 4-monooxygenase n=1 Tax=Dinoponera quadriceps TaxID=609295 RepID=A0A6P3Y5V7_DINQU|nr:PREDICTED: probable 4-coumarate--CoA ligase 3 [Dinoponera quadriceps]XP_014486260.1 PREDICTED: probable 4-coumarate--CoA ligase 3 [Dinoponera quadriceps]XP_014486261.1 PREDICTED: probable 4-coumarate--CoA ligase 3 [Dinoponera quadriceps]XP_014486262.1 PREDICTED: probable 4-coumarate--CoA ligase 3 [Dinoponera quadriceps]